MLVSTPRIRNSCRARSARVQASERFGIPGGQFHQERVIERAKNRSSIGGPVEATPIPPGASVGLEAAIVRRELVCGILGGYPALHGGSPSRNLALRRNRERRLVESASLCHENLGTDQVDAGHHFRDGVLHLDPGVCLDEEPLPRIGIDQEFHGAGIDITRGLSDPDRRRTNLVPQVV